MILIATLLFAYALPTPPADKTLRDDHWGECPAFTHRHPTVDELNSGKAITANPDLNRGFLVAPGSDGLCHDDKTDDPIKEHTNPLPKPKFQPSKKAVWA